MPPARIMPFVVRLLIAVVYRAGIEFRRFSHRIRASFVSQADPEFLAKVNEEFGPFDIILDDGSHKTHLVRIVYGMSIQVDE